MRATDGDYALSPQQALWAKISEVKFEGATLRESFDWLAEVLGTNMHVDWGALGEAGVQPEMPINLNLRWVRVPRLLSFIFQETGRGDQLTYYISGNVLVITSKAQADAELFTRVYPVQDLVIRPGKVDRVDRSILAQPGDTTAGRAGTGNSSVGRSRGGNGLWGQGDDDDRDEDEDSDKVRGQEVVDMVKQLAPADIWEENGGKARVRYFRGNLVLTAPRSVHALIAGPIRE